jgi:hypothetical protein
VGKSYGNIYNYTAYGKSPEKESLSSCGTISVL